MYIPRFAESRLQDGLSQKKILLVLGARQVGKTTLLQHCLGNKHATFLNLDIEIDKMRLIAASHLPPEDALRSLGSPNVLIIDEAQRLPDVSRIVKGWYDSKVKATVILLGSSSLNLLDQSAESLTGRNVKLTLPPLLFEEVIQASSWYSPVYTTDMLTATFSKQLESTLMDVLVYGSYPETIRSLRKEEYVLNLASDYILKDVVQAGLVKSVDVIKKLLILIAQQVGETLSTNQLSLALGISRLTVDRYLDLLERTYVIFRLPPFSGKGRAEVTKQQRIFFWDTGIRNAILHDFNTSPFRCDIEQLWHNWVVAETAKRILLSDTQYQLYFWRTRDNSRVDLIIQGNDTLYAFNTCWTERTFSPSKAFTAQYGIRVESACHTHPFAVSSTLPLQ